MRESKTAGSPSGRKKKVPAQIEPNIFHPGPRGTQIVQTDDGKLIK